MVVGSRFYARSSLQQHKFAIASSRLNRIQVHFSNMAARDAPTTSRLRNLRELMKSKQVDIYGESSFILHLLIVVVPSEDAHQSEYVCAADKRREFISGNISSGSAIPLIAKVLPDRLEQPSLPATKRRCSPTVVTLIKPLSNWTRIGS